MSCGSPDGFGRLSGKSAIVTSGGRGSRAAAQAMIRTGGGFIVNISSILYLMVVPALSAYLDTRHNVDTMASEEW